ncbi:hypothetical protein bcere0026_26960 [Bacillus mycoides]|uniref:Uncharacterized protein n=1 Tax=Bacillus mycoides TaxID=1405 RepID=C2XVH2_BACMY|nr:hypothetical protein bcere0026_26960 [Bacillus mycoides]
MSFIFTIVPPFCFKLIHTYIIILFLIFNLIISITIPLSFLSYRKQLNYCILI